MAFSIHRHAMAKAPPTPRTSLSKKGKAAAPARPIELYFWPTSNGLKISIMLEECRLPYVIKPIDIGKGDQFAPHFLAISPNNRIPAIIDPDGPGGGPLSIFESGAILQYLGRKVGKFYPVGERARTEVDQWLIWQVANLGPICGQVHHFRNYAQVKSPYAVERFVNEAHRLYEVMNTRLADRDYLAGRYSIADIASWPWARGYKNRGLDIAAFPNVKGWLDRVAVRPAVQIGCKVGEDLRSPTYDLAKDLEAQKILFGQRAPRLLPEINKT